MNFITTEIGAYTRVFDASMKRTHYLPTVAYAALNKANPGAQDRLGAAAEYTVNQWGEITKSPTKLDAMLSELLTLRAGAVKPTIPQAVRDALAALNAAVLAG